MKTIKEAAQKWVSEFNVFPQDMIKKLIKMEPDMWQEVTKPTAGDRVYVFHAQGMPYGCVGKITGFLEKSDAYLVDLDDGRTIEVEESGMQVERYDFLPMWGTMWQFGDSLDEHWLEANDGIRIMSDCGFRIYRHDEWGHFFGIDGAGYSFYENHWIPAYEKRGLMWHR